MASHISETNQYNYKVQTISLDGSENMWEIHPISHCAVYSLILSSDISRPSHLVVPGLTNESFESTIQVVCSRLNQYRKKYHKILIINFCHNGNNTIKSLQDNVFSSRDKSENENKSIKREEYYESEMKLYDTCAQAIDYVMMNHFKLTNIEVLGKSEGGCIATYLVIKKPIYTALYLAVPYGPFNVMKLRQLGSNRLKNMRFHFGWAIDDTYMFPWGRQSNEEKSVYDKTMEEFANMFKRVNYTSRYYGSADHEVPYDMIDDICAK